jgi:hypothetical protein
MSICVIVKFETYQIIIVLLDMNLLTCLCSYSAVTMLPYGYLAGKGKGTNSYQLHLEDKGISETDEYANRRVNALPLSYGPCPLPSLPPVADLGVSGVEVE